MFYQVVPARIENDGRVTEGKRKQVIPFPHPLELGGLYFMRPGKLYRVVARIDIEEE